MKLGTIGSGKMGSILGRDTADAVPTNSDLNSSRVPGFREGWWTLKAAIDQSAPARIFASTLNQRLVSECEGEFDKVLSAASFECSGHEEEKP